MIYSARAMVVIAAFSACASAAPSTVAPPALTRCTNSTDGNRDIALAFYEVALIEKDVRFAFETFMTSGFIEHKPDVAGGTRENAILYLEGLMKNLPAARWEVLRSAADGNLVAVHARFRPAPGAPEYAIADFFRVENCRIVEHWDVVAPPTDKAINPNPRF